MMRYNAAKSNKKKVSEPSAAREYCGGPAFQLSAFLLVTFTLRRTFGRREGGVKEYAACAASSAAFAR